MKSKTKVKSSIPSLIKADGSEAKTAHNKAETLNNYFSSVFSDDNLHDQQTTLDEGTFFGNYLNSFEITKEMVATKLRELNTEKSPGPDKWHPIFLKKIADLISSPLSIIFQKSLNEGIVPSQWREATITPIHKKGSKNLDVNYRPVSITSILCKLMESIIRDKIVNHLDQNKILSDKQHGFVPLRNCMSNLLICIEKWTEIIEGGSPIDVIYTDFAKAFDRVSHEKLLQKTKTIGIVGKTLAWINAFLRGREQRVS